MVDVLAIPVILGIKPPHERFPGAINSFACEAMMRDGKALQMGTSHELGQNFARIFDIDYLDDAGETQLCWTTSWGTSTRMVGGLVMAHGDDRGLVVPPNLAPIQCVVLLVRDEESAGAHAAELADELRAAGVRVRLDDKVATSFGRRVTDWELKGVPVRVEVGPRDLREGNVTLVRRDTGEKTSVPADRAAAEVATLVPTIQAAMLAAATADRDARIADASSIDDAAEAAQAGFARVAWDLVRGEGVGRLAERSVSVRCLVRADGSVPADEDEADLTAYVARAY
jgi:prolyl-tRNA synthetase